MNNCNGNSSHSGDIAWKQGHGKSLTLCRELDEGYASQTSRTFDIPVSEIQKQLQKFEQAGILVSRKIGTIRLYTFNPRDPALKSLEQLLRQVLDTGIPEPALEQYYRGRRRPRRAGKTA